MGGHLCMFCRCQSAIDGCTQMSVRAPQLAIVQPPLESYMSSSKSTQKLAYESGMRLSQLEHDPQQMRIQTTAPTEYARQMHTSDFGSSMKRGVT
eukprot:368067-Amphidinium_carterae.2